MSADGLGSSLTPPNPAVTYAAFQYQGRLFWITCKRPKLLRKAGCLQLIQNSTPSVTLMRQCCIRIFILDQPTASLENCYLQLKFETLLRLLRLKLLSREVAEVARVQEKKVDQKFWNLQFLSYTNVIHLKRKLRTIVFQNWIFDFFIEKWGKKIFSQFSMIKIQKTTVWIANFYHLFCGAPLWNLCSAISVGIWRPLLGFKSLALDQCNGTQERKKSTEHSQPRKERSSAAVCRLRQRSTALSLGFPVVHLSHSTSGSLGVEVIVKS